MGARRAKNLSCLKRKATVEFAKARPWPTAANEFDVVWLFFVCLLCIFCFVVWVSFLMLLGAFLGALGCLLAAFWVPFWPLGRLLGRSWPLLG